jgi:RNA polymerase sigma-70 factor (ECF subfamily)
MSIAPAPIAPTTTAAAETAALLFERHSRRLFAFCLRRLGTPEEAEDAVQQTFMKAFAAVRGGFVPAAEKAWLYRIAENVCTDRLRSATFRLRHESSPDALAAVAAPATDRHAEIGAALASLGEHQRRALVLREWHGLSYREIGSQLSLSQSAVEALLFRARRALARRLEAFSFAGSLKSLLTGGGAAKLTAAAVVTVGVGALAVPPVVDRIRKAPSPTTPANVGAKHPAPAVAFLPPDRASNSELQSRPAVADASRDPETPRIERPTAPAGGSSGPAVGASNSELQALDPPAASVTEVAPAASGLTVPELTLPAVEVPTVPDVSAPAPEEVVETVVETLPELPELPPLLP